MMGNRAAGPGGAQASGIKKRRLSALEERAGKRKKQGPVPQPAPPPKVQTRQQQQPMALYSSLPASRCKDPVGKALKFPSKVEVGRPQDLQKKLVEIAATDKGRSLEKITRDIQNGFGAKSFLTLHRERRPRTIEAKRDRKPTLGMLSNRKRKAMGIDPLQEHYTPEMLDKIREVWQTTSAISTFGKKHIMSSISNLEYHGCFLRVQECKNPLTNGLEGVVVKISKTAVHLAVKRSRKLHGTDQTETDIVIRPVQKDGSLFSFEISDLKETMQVAVPGSNLT